MVFHVERPRIAAERKRPSTCVAHKISGQHRCVKETTEASRFFLSLFIIAPDVARHVGKKLFLPGSILLSPASREADHRPSESHIRAPGVFCLDRTSSSSARPEADSRVSTDCGCVLGSGGTAPLYIHRRLYHFHRRSADATVEVVVAVPGAARRAPLRARRLTRATRAATSLRRSSLATRAITGLMSSLRKKYTYIYIYIPFGKLQMDADVLHSRFYELTSLFTRNQIATSSELRRNAVRVTQFRALCSSFASRDDPTREQFVKISRLINTSTHRHARGNTRRNLIAHRNESHAHPLKSPSL